MQSVSLPNLFSRRPSDCTSKKCTYVRSVDVVSWRYKRFAACKPPYANQKDRAKAKRTFRPTIVHDTSRNSEFEMSSSWSVLVNT